MKKGYFFKSGLKSAACLSLKCKEGVSEPRAVATGSGRTAAFISARFAIILFREVSLLMQGDFLIRSLPLAVLTHRVNAWARENGALKLVHHRK
jgi:hypothetical protein